MAADKRRLGKGLDALFLDNAVEDRDTAGSELPIAEIEPDRNQPRSAFDEQELTELADSISQHGVLQPIIVRPVPDGGYRIIAGERRWRASRMAGKTTIPAIVRNCSDLEAMTFALVENLQRADLNPVEEALGYRRLMDDSGMTQEQISTHVGRSRSAIANSLRLLSLPDEVLTLLREDKLTAGHGKAILAIEDPEVRVAVAQRVAEDGVTVREAEKRFQSKRKPAPKRRESKAPAAQRGTFGTEVEQALKAELGVEVSVNYNKGRGALTISFYNDQQLADIANRLAGRKGRR